MQTIKHIFRNRKYGDLKAFAARLGKSSRSIERWVTDEHFCVHEGYVYRRIAKIGPARNENNRFKKTTNRNGSAQDKNG